MTATTYANAVSNIQSTVYGIINADATVATYCKHIIDGTPLKVSRERGFPYIIVGTPSMPRTPRVLNNATFDHDITIPITVASVKESVVRNVADSVMNALNSNQSTTRTAKLNWFKVKSTSMTPQMLDDGTIVYMYEINVGYRFTG